MSYFDLEFGRVVVYVKNSIVEFKKIVNDNLVDLTSDEKIVVDSFLNFKDNGFDYYDGVKDIVLENKNIKNYKDVLIPFFEFIEDKIPKDYIQNFYRNLKTLDFKFIEDSKEVNGKYNSKENIVSINKNYLEKIENESKEFSNPDDYYNEKVGFVLIHELFHMASSYYDREKNVSCSGFDRFPRSDYLSANTSLTEGVTEYMAFSFVSGFYAMESAYHLEVLLVSQLKEILGMEVLMDSYFKVSGIDDLKENLIEIHCDKDKVDQLFVDLEIGCISSHENVVNSSLGYAQENLVNCFESKLKRDIEFGISYDKLNDEINRFEECLITDKSLVSMNKDPNNFHHLEESINKFYKIKDKMINSKIK